MNKQDIILKTAQKLFSQFGLNKVNMEEIAREARVSKATLYSENNHTAAPRADIFILGA